MDVCVVGVDESRGRGEGEGLILCWWPEGTDLTCWPSCSPSTMLLLSLSLSVSFFFLFV